MSINRKVMLVALASLGFVSMHEGYSSKAYLDPVGIPTICYGDTVGVKLGDVKSKEQCNALLKIRLIYYAREVDKIVQTPMSLNRHKAFTSFSYNVGLRAFRDSTLVKKINAGDPKACDWLTKTEYDMNGKCFGYGCGWANGKQLKGLINRRKEEKKLCNS